jgi:hypothetical protein
MPIEWSKVREFARAIKDEIHQPKANEIRDL